MKNKRVNNHLKTTGLTILTISITSLVYICVEFYIKWHYFYNPLKVVLFSLILTFLIVITLVTFGIYLYKLINESEKENE